VFTHECALPHDHTGFQISIETLSISILISGGVCGTQRSMLERFNRWPFCHLRGEEQDCEYQLDQREARSKTRLVISGNQVHPVRSKHSVTSDVQIRSRTDTVSILDNVEAQHDLLMTSAIVDMRKLCPCCCCPLTLFSNWLGAAGCWRCSKH
jgi:hypothetical protein